MGCSLRTCSKPARMVLQVEEHSTGKRSFKVWSSDQIVSLPHKAVAYCKAHGEAAVDSLTDLLIDHDIEPRPGHVDWHQPSLALLLTLHSLLRARVVCHYLVIAQASSLVIDPFLFARCASSRNLKATEHRPPNRTRTRTPAATAHQLLHCI